MNREPFRWTWWSQIVLGIALFGTFVPFGVTSTTELDSSDYSRMPQVSADELFARSTRLQDVLNSPASADPRDYFHAVVETRRIEALATKLRHGDGISDLRVDPVVLRSRNDPIQLMGRYTERFGNKMMAQVSEEMRPWMNQELQRYEAAMLPGSGPRILDAFTRFYGMSFLVAILFFMARLKGEGRRIWPELLSLRIFGASFVWLGVLWLYPSRINPITQAKDALRIIGTFMAGAISLGAMAGVANAGERKKSDGSADTGNVLVLSDLPMPKVSASAGVGSQKVTGNGTVVHRGPVDWGDVNLAFDGGWSLDFWASRARSGSKASDENDVTLSKSWKQGAWSPTVSFAYYDIRPLGTASGGDMVSPIIQADRPAGNGLTFSAKGEAYVITGSSPRFDGYDVSFGLNGSHPLGPADVGHAVSAVYADGPFGQKPGLSLRYDATASVPLSTRVKGMLSLKAFAPLLGAGDRTANVTAGFGLVAAF